MISIETKLNRMNKQFSKEEIYKLLYGDGTLALQYKQLKQFILKSIKERTSLGHVDVFIFLDPPRTAQSAIPFNLTRALKLVPVPLLRAVGGFMNKDLMKKLEKEPIHEFDPSLPSKGIKMAYLEVEDVGEFLNYFCDIKNPVDYLGLLKKFSEELVPRTADTAEKKRFITYFLDKYVYPSPKLFLIASSSIYSRPFLFWNVKRINAAYSALGNAVIKKIKSGHFMSETIPFPTSAGQGKLPVIAKEVLHFLETNL